ncbi:MAG TPA: hypothetical protein VFK02_22075 [Kofleriaceae bacterium]|nr:hypothetical protein [Kofleriaceae bacterium]
MKTRKLQIVTLLASTALGTTAWAGYRYPFEVQIDAVNHTVKGALGSARASSDPNQAIGCRITTAAGTSPVAYCFAVDATGHRAECSSTDQAIVTVARAITDSSMISFGWDAQGICLTLSVENYSSNPPLEP